ncbi:MAG: hypothetical protein HY081_11705 [Gammaproteobacteria bacterium]|nr:hypothetical protein [Gammaproteobacteria bacterium]
MSTQGIDLAQARDVAHDFSGLSLTPANFHAFYTKVISLRFPMQVAHVLELRYLINHTVDQYKEPPLTPDYRQFRDSLQAAIDSFIDSQRHSERMLNILSMLRDIHYVHSIDSRNAEIRLREAMEANRMQHLKSIRYGLFFILAAVSFVIMWLTLGEPSIIIKLLPAGYSYFALRFFHKLPELDRNHEKLTLELNEVLRRRVRSINWKTLIHKLALVLGFKRVPGVEVFHIENEFENRETSVYH